MIIVYLTAIRSIDRKDANELLQNAKLKEQITRHKIAEHESADLGRI